MRRAHRLPKRLVRLTSLSVCLALVLTSLSMIPFRRVNGKGAFSQGQANQGSDNGKARKVKAEPPQTGPPSGTLPDLDEVKRRHGREPEAPAPIPSTVRSKRKPPESRHGRKVGDPLPPVRVGSAGNANISDLVASAGTRLLDAPRSSETNLVVSNNLLAWNRVDASILDLFTAPAFHSLGNAALKFLRYTSLQSYQAISDSPFSLSLTSPRDPSNESAFNLPLSPMPEGNGYTYSRIITIDHGKVPNTDQSNFPLLISGTYSYLKTVANGGNVQNSNGYDVIFTSDSGCGTKLSHEVETYSATTGAVNYWVKVPTVSHTSDTVIYMCYGNASITTDQSNKTAVWDANFKGVWHLPNGTSLTANDSTSNGVNGTITSTAAATGQVDGGGSFDGSSSKIDLGNASALDGMTALTISAWIKPNSLTGANRILTKWLGSFLVGTKLGAGDVLRLAVQKTGGGLSIFDSPASTLTTGSWQHCVVTWSQPNAATIYVNGTAKTVTIIQDQNVTSTGPSSTVVQIGSPSDGVGNRFDGLIDEVRMSNVARSADWSKTEYYNQSLPSAFYTISAASGNQPPVANAGVSYSGIVGQNVPFNGGGSFDPDGSIASYAWNFGDGGTGSGVAPTHAYGGAGTYNVTLTVTDNLGAQASASTTITITSSSSDQFVQNFLQWGLARAPQGDEAPYWSDMMRAAYPQGQTSMLIAMREFGMTVFESAEYAGRNRSDHDYVYDLYKTYLMREPDQAGWNFWTGQVPHAGRESVRHAFDECGEFSTIISTLTASGSPSSAVASLSTARVDPFNQSGNQLQARDCEWSLPLLSLPGRAGLDLGLGLSYSSLVWTRSGPYVYFDADNGSPSPGFRLGFATIQGRYFDAQVGRNVYLLVTSSGQRVELRQVGTSNTYEAGDSSYLQLIVGGNSLLLRTTDGTQIGFTRFENDWHTTTIEDRNGNLINVNYDWRGDITNITDTLSRMITFNYDSNANLISITQSWAGQAQPHTWASFGWTTVTMQPNFGGEVVGANNGEVIPVLAQVGLSDGSGHTFEYTGAGQVNVIRRYTSDNVQRSYLAYDYAPASDYIPRITQTRVSADNWTGLNGVPAEVVTQFIDPLDGWHVMVAPDGTAFKEFYGGTGGSPAWQRGLVTQSEVWSGDIRQKWTTTAWTQDNTGVSYQTNPRVTESNVYDSGSNRRRTTIDYDHLSYAQYGLPYLVKEYAADGLTEIRQTFTDYNLGQAYLDRRIIGLVSSTRIYDPVAAQWQTKLTYGYDDPSKTQSQATTATQHDQSFDASFFVRGNVTSVSRWDVTDIDSPTKALTTQASYNAAGSVLTSADPLSHQNTISYTDSFSDNADHNTFAYPTNVTDADSNQTSVQYNYDFGAETRVQGPPAGQSQGVIQTIAYDSAARVDRVTTVNTSAYTRFWYGPNYIGSLSTVNNVADEAYTNRVFDGAGRLTGVANNNPGSSGGYKAQLTQYDLMGRVMKQSNPAEINGSWIPAGDDAAGWLYTQQTYDWKGRPLVTTNTDGTQKYASYSACGCAGSEVATLTDEVGRRQKIYNDVLGRTAKTEILNWNGSVYSTSANTYNVLDQVKLVRQYQGTDTSSVYQDTTMTYDGYGRLLTKHVPEQNAGTATVYSYNTDDTVQSVTDARGASATYSYNGRHLVTGINYSAPTGITPTSNVSFGYDAAGNRTSMTDGLGSKSYTYNQLSEMMSETRTFTNVGTFTLSYDHNLAGELKKITDPTNMTINYGYDSSGRMTNVTGSDSLYAGVSNYASNFQYRAWDGMKMMTDGSSRTSSFSYNARLQLSHFDISGSLVDQNYDYYNDGRVSFAHNTMDTKFDRSYFYDHAARLTEAKTGGQARGDTGDVPYHETFSYDAWSNTTNRLTQAWNGTQVFADSASYTNTRRNGWGYDADGRNTSIDARTHSYDAAGQQTLMTGPEWIVGHPVTISIGNGFDGDGQRVMQQGPFSVTTYYLRSSALRGAVVEEINSSGQKQTGYVYAGGALLANQSNNQVTWKHSTPAGTGLYDTHADGTYGRIELDPLGADVGLTSEPLDDTGGGDGDIGHNQIPLMLDSRLADVANPAGGCVIDGVPGSCDVALAMLGMGVAAPCPNADCGPTRVYNPATHQNEWRFLRAFADGLLGYVPLNATSDGRGGITLSNGKEAWGYLGESLYGLIPQNSAPSPTPCPGSIPEGIAKQILRIASQEHIDPTLLSVTMRHESSFGTNMKANPRYIGSGRNRRYVGADVGPMGTATNIWGKSPFIDGLSDPFGTVAMNERTHEYESFNGNFEDNITLAARAFSMDILPRSKGNADAAGMYRGPGDYQGRYDQYVRESPGDRRQLNCLAGRR